MDTQIVREREAWYKAGASAVAMYSEITAANGMVILQARQVDRRGEVDIDRY